MVRRAVAKQKPAAGRLAAEELQRHPAFAARLNESADKHPYVPRLGAGRLTYVRERLSNMGITVSLEAVRRWFAGEALPRPEYGSALAQVLGVDSHWLLEGAEQRQTRAVRTRNPLATGAVNIVAGLIQTDGGTISFPEDSNNPFTHRVDLQAIIAGVFHSFHIVAAEEGEKGSLVFPVPADLGPAVLPLGFKREKGFRFRVYVIGDPAIEVGQRRSGCVEVDLTDRDVREVTSFKQRLQF